MKRLIYLPLMALLLWLQGCVTDDFGVNVRPNDDVGTSYKVLIESTIDQHDNTRVDDSGFCTGDDVGIYLVNYDGDTPGELLVEDNQADNVKFTLGEDGCCWRGCAGYHHILGFYPKNMGEILQFCKKLQA